MKERIFIKNIVFELILLLTLFWSWSRRIRYRIMWGSGSEVLILYIISSYLWGSGAEFLFCIKNYNFVIIFEDPEPIFMMIRRWIIICINNYNYVIIFEDPEPIFMVIRSRIINCINNYNFVIIFEDPEPIFRIRDEL